MNGGGEKGQTVIIDRYAKGPSNVELACFRVLCSPSASLVHSASQPSGPLFSESIRYATTPRWFRLPRIPNRSCGDATLPVNSSRIVQEVHCKEAGRRNAVFDYSVLAHTACNGESGFAPKEILVISAYATGLAWLPSWIRDQAGE
jgi:hypothetical protein